MMCLYLTSLIVVDQKSITPSNDVPVPDNHDVIDVPDLHDVIDGDKPNLVMWLSQLAQPGGSIKWLNLVAQPVATLDGSARWLIHWLNQMAEPVATLDG